LPDFIGRVRCPSAAIAATFTRPLVVGSSGADVTALQQILQQQGYLSTSPTGYFGPLTAKAVAAFQTTHNIEPLGGVGPLTRNILNGLVGTAQHEPTASSCPLILNRPLVVGSSGADVTALQHILVSWASFPPPRQGTSAI
jgi:hypothetical protein